MAFAACTNDSVEEQVAIRHEAPETITVGFEDDDTRIQLNDAQKTVWTKGDLVSVFYRSDANQKWHYQGETGERVAELTRVEAGVATEAMNRVVVVYPYSENYYINTETYNIQASLPAVQTYLKDSYGLNGNIMISQSEYNNFSLKSVCGWLKLQLTGDGEKVKSITLRGNNGEQVAGELYINSADATVTLSSDTSSADDGETVGAGGGLVFEDTILKEVTLDCGEGIELGTEATAFYIALPPQTYTEGITVDITTINGLAMTKSTDKEVVIERNHIQPMTAFTADFHIPETWKIYYTATQKVEPYDKTVFGATYLSNVWDSETGEGVITFDNDVTMIGENAFAGCTSLTSVNIPDSVTSIEDSAFYRCRSLTSVNIPDSVTSIGEMALYSCDSLTSVNIPDSVTTIGEGAFYWCKSLTSVNIPDSVTTIGGYLFYWCKSLTSVTIGDSVTSIGDWAFVGCDSLTSVTIGDSVTTIGDYAFNSCYSLTSVNIPDSVTEIGYQAFRDCSSLTSVAIGDSVTTIGDHAFIRCTSLTSVNIPDSVTTIGGYAFQNCTSLKSVTIGDSVTSIGEYTFSICKSLTSVTIPDSVTSIGDWAFWACTSLTSVYCYATVPPSLGSRVFYDNASGRRIYVYEECVKLYKSAWNSDSIYTNGQNCPDTTTIEYTTNDGNTITSSKLPIISNIYENGVGTLVVVGKISHIPNNAFRNCDSLTSVNIPDSVTTIGNSAFYGCASLTSVNIPDSVTAIGGYAFYSCDSLTSVTIGDSVTKIGNYAFAYCDSLTSVNIPDSVTTIGERAFQFCESLTSVNIPDSVTEIGEEAFYNCTSLTSVTIGDSVTVESVVEALRYCSSLQEFKGKFASEDGRCLIDDGILYYVAPGGLTEYTIPDSVTTIGGYAFDWCTSLTSVNIPDSVTSIGNYAFAECYSLTSVNIGDSVTTIESSAFSDCSSLTSVYCKATTPPALGYYAFYYNGSGRKIYVPMESVDAYKSATRWSEYASDIVGYNF